MATEPKMEMEDDFDEEIIIEREVGKDLTMPVLETLKDPEPVRRTKIVFCGDDEEVLEPHGKRTCLVRGCSHNNDEHGLQFFKLPRLKAGFNDYVKLVGRPDLLNRANQNFYICEVHFAPEVFVIKNSRKTLPKNTKPTLLLPPAAGSHAEDESSPRALSNSLATFQKKRLKRHLSQRAKFEALCDKFLLKNIADLVKAETKKKSAFHKVEKNYTDSFYLHLYHVSPPTYISLQPSMGLPTVKQLKALYNASIRDTNNIVETLKPKINSLSDLGKNCCVLIGGVDLKPHLYYNVSEDKLFGICRVDEEKPHLYYNASEDELLGICRVEGQQPLPAVVARYAIVLMVRGLCEQWTMPIDYALYWIKDSTRAKNMFISTWVQRFITELNGAGLKVRVCLSSLSSKAITSETGPPPTVQKPFFRNNDRQIYYAYDPTHLIKRVYLCLREHEFHFHGSVAKWQDILQFYETDSKKLYRLVPELSEKHVRSTETGSVEASVAKETLSERVAAGIANYVDFGQMDSSAMGTVKMLTIIDRLYKFMTSSSARNSSEYEKPFRNSEFQTNFVVESLKFFRDLKIIKNGVDVTDKVKFVKQYQMSIRAMMLLHEELSLEGIPDVHTNNIRMNVFDDFIHKIIEKSKTKDITAWRLIAAYRNMLFKNIMKPTKGKPCPPIISVIIKNYLQNSQLYSESEEEQKNSLRKLSTITLPVKKNVYKNFKLPLEHQTIAICKFLMEKCYEVHKLCSFQAKKRSGQPRYTRYAGFFGDVIWPNNPDPRSKDAPPSDNLLELVEALDRQLEKCFTFHLSKDPSTLLLAPLKSRQVTLQELEKLNPPCLCFPTAYMAQLFYRLRISQQLRANNRRFRKSKSNVLVFCYETLDKNSK